MNLRQLEFFVAVAKTEHMTQVAKELNTSQPNISHAINNLERELGVALFEKKGRNLSLTRYGRAFYEQVAPSLQSLNMAQNKITEMVDPNLGEIKIGFIYTLGAQSIPSKVRDFKQMPDNERIRFLFSQGNSHKIIDMLQQNQIDLGFCSKVEADSDLQFDLFTKEELILVVPENHPLAIHEEIELDETTAFPYIYYHKNSGLRPILDEVIQKFSLDLQISYELEEDHSILGFVSAGFGIALMPDILSIASYPVKKIKIRNALPERNIYLVSKKQETLPLVVKKFKDYCLKKSDVGLNL